jgi:hypothetical protein
VSCVARRTVRGHFSEHVSQLNHVIIFFGISSELEMRPKFTTAITFRLELLMSGRIRSKQGCWTCKLRKKKCDERRPNCSACESLTITCHGFGPKPDWMDNGQRERDVTNSLKEVVKSVSRRKVTQQTNERGQVIKIAPRPENVTGKDSGSSSSEAASRQEQTITSPSDHRLSEDNGVSILEDKSIVSVVLSTSFTVLKLITVIRILSLLDLILIQPIDP